MAAAFSRTMAAANPQPHITLNPFRGKTDESPPDFGSLLRSLVDNWSIPNANRLQFFQFHFLDQAMQFFRSIPLATIDAAITTSNFSTAILALRDYPCNPNLRELHQLQLHNLKFDLKNGSSKDFMVKVQIKAKQVYP